MAQVRFEINPDFFPQTRDKALKVMKGMAADIQEQAKHNVEPGVGPGPHPHRTPHEDTGALMRSIKKKVWEKRSEVGFAVYTDKDYGLFLEIGWHSAAGNFWRYPWLLPALRDVAPEALKQTVAEVRF